MPSVFVISKILSGVHSLLQSWLYSCYKVLRPDDTKGRFRNCYYWSGQSAAIAVALPIVAAYQRVSCGETVGQHILCGNCFE